MYKFAAFFIMVLVIFTVIMACDDVSGMDNSKRLLEAELYESSFKQVNEIEQQDLKWLNLDDLFIEQHELFLEAKFFVTDQGLVIGEQVFPIKIIDGITKVPAEDKASIVRELYNTVQPGNTVMMIVEDVSNAKQTD